MVYSAEKMPESHKYDDYSDIVSENYVRLVCRECGYVLVGAGCIYLPESMDVLKYNKKGVRAK